MWEYSMRFLIAMILGICVLLLFITGKSDQTAMEDKLTVTHSTILVEQTNEEN